MPNVFQKGVGLKQRLVFFLKKTSVIQHFTKGTQIQHPTRGPWPGSLYPPDLLHESGYRKKQLAPHATALLLRPKPLQQRIQETHRPVRRVAQMKAQTI